jgi:protein gp37
MAANTGVDWANYSHPVIAGCDLESPGCIHCYAIKDAWRMAHNPNPKISAKYAGLVRKTDKGELVWTGKINFHEPSLLQPLTWRKPGRVFLTPEGDLFHPEVAVEAIDRILAVSALAQWHDWLILSKRTARMALYFLDPETPKRIARAAIALVIGQRLTGNHRLALDRVSHAGITPWPLPNFWLITSVERQREADLRREPMRRLAQAGWLTGVSFEPALERVIWTGWEFLRWLVSGGESGAKARISPIEAFRTAREFCSLATIAYNHKQNGAWIETEQLRGATFASRRRVSDDEFAASLHAEDGSVLYGGRRFLVRRSSEDRAFYARMGKKLTGRLLDGGLYDAYPAEAQTTPSRELAEVGA